MLFDAPRKTSTADVGVSKELPNIEKVCSLESFSVILYRTPDANIKSQVNASLQTTRYLLHLIKRFFLPSS